MVDNIDDAIKLLVSDTTAERFSAAHFFIKNPLQEYKDNLISQRRVELVRHVKMALDKAIGNIEKSSSESSVNIEVINDEKIERLRNNFLKAEAIDEFSGIVLHELAPKIGILKTTARFEIQDFDNSETKKSILSLDRIFKAIETLRKSASKPIKTEFDLAQLIRDIVYEENTYAINILFEGVQPCIIKSDINILSLAISNGIRNGLESILSVQSSEVKPEIIICWGKSAEYNWVTIIDEGVGLKGSFDDASKIGITSKDSHTGFGLPIIIQAIESLGGDVELSNVNSGGAKLDLKWVNF